MHIDITIPVPSWMAEKLAAIASVCEKSVDEVAAAFFAAEVVHTSEAKGLSFGRKVVHTSAR